MKKKATVLILISTLLLSLLMIFSQSSTYAEGNDFSSYSDDELYELLAQIQQEIQKRNTREQASPASDFIFASNGNEVSINSYIGSSADVVIPDEIDGVPVTRIKGEAFYSNDNLHSVQLPKHLVEIGKSAFALNDYLTGILDIPSSVKRIGGEAFTGNCFTGIIINSSFVMDEYGSTYFDAAEFVFIREGLNPVFGDSTFSKSPKMRFAIIPASVTSLPDDAFENCNLLTIITPSGSAAEAWAIEHFFPVDTEHYDAYVKEYEALYPQHW